MLLAWVSAHSAAQFQVSFDSGTFGISASTAITFNADYEAPVVGVAAEALSADIKAVSGIDVAAESGDAQQTIHIGTVDEPQLHDFCDAYTGAAGNLLAHLQGKHEAYAIVAADAANLYIIGSDPRGAAYGVFHLSRQMGVSPLVWWADVVPSHHDNIYVSGELLVDEPSVRYRGLFINDEDWGLQPWAAAKMDTKVLGADGNTYKDIGPATYERVFELMLRLRANIIWPAMHPCTHAFWFYPDNPKLAKKYDIMLGSSHCEPMARNNVDEWTRFGGTSSNFNYATNASMVQRYWAKRVGESRGQDVMYTLGMRGVHDGAIQGYSSVSDKVTGLTSIIAYQRKLINDSIGNPTTVPQMFCPYKEVLDAYNAGLQVPDDVILTWVDDNHGYIRQMPKAAEQKRSGGNGIYYHISYWGSPVDYLWLESTPPALISYELCRAYDMGIRNLWIINVGDIKPAEAELQFAMDLAFDIDAWRPDNAYNYSRQWAAETFGEDVAQDIADIKLTYYQLASAGKPEHIASVNYTNHEMDQRISAYEQLATKVAIVKQQIPNELRDAYYQLVEYPVLGAYNMNVMTFRAKQSFTYANAGMREQALTYAQQAKKAYQDIQTLTDYYNQQCAGGKWNGIMSSKPRKQAQFNMPSVATEANVASAVTALPSDSIPFVNPQDYAAAAPSVKTINGLGIAPTALCVYPMDMTNYTKADDAPWVEYELPLQKGTHNITVKCLPTFPLNAEHATLRIAMKVADGAYEQFSIKNTATQGEWNTNVLQGFVARTKQFKATADGTVTLRLALMDPGIAVCGISIETEETGDDLTELITNADFEYKSATEKVGKGGLFRGIPYGWTLNCTFPGNSYGINTDAQNYHGDTHVWFYNKGALFPDNFQLSQTIPAEKLTPGIYKIRCRLWCQTGKLGTCRLFANNNVQYFGKETDYVSNLTEGEVNTFANYTGTGASGYPLQEMQVTVQLAEGEDLTLGIRSGCTLSNGSKPTSTSDVTGWFKADYFRLEYMAPLPDDDPSTGISNGESVNGKWQSTKWQNGKWFDLSGRPLPAKSDRLRGIVIQKGRKYINR